MQVIIGILPELLALVFSATVAIIGVYQGMTLKEVSIQTVFSVLVFYIIGLFLKTTFIKIRKETILGVMKKSYEKYRAKNSKKDGSNVDYVVNASDDEFNELHSSKLNDK